MASTLIITAMIKKNPYAPSTLISHPVTIGPAMAPRPLINSMPPDAAAMSSVSRKSFVWAISSE